MLALRSIYAVLDDTAPRFFHTRVEACRERNTRVDPTRRALVLTKGKPGGELHPYRVGWQPCWQPC